MNRADIQVGQRLIWRKQGTAVGYSDDPTPSEHILVTVRKLCRQLVTVETDDGRLVHVGPDRLNGPKTERPPDLAQLSLNL